MSIGVGPLIAGGSRGYGTANGHHSSAIVIDNSHVNSHDNCHANGHAHNSHSHVVNGAYVTLITKPNYMQGRWTSRFDH
jgi:hypothetical protein